MSALLVGCASPYEPNNVTTVTMSAVSVSRVAPTARQARSHGVMLGTLVTRSAYGHRRAEIILRGLTDRVLRAEYPLRSVRLRSPGGGCAAAECAATVAGRGVCGGGVCGYGRRAVILIFSAGYS